MTRNHPLGPDCDSQEFYRLVRMEQHPDRQPGSAVTMSCRDDDDADADEDFESDWIDGLVLKIIWMKRTLIHLSV
jgi:hypothetical protein